MKAEELRQHVHALLRGARWKGKWLAVLDDLPDPKDERARWVAKEFPFESGATLVTSRSDAWAAVGGAGKWDKCALGGMTEQEACGWVWRRMPMWPEDHDGVMRSVQKLGCLALAVEAAVAHAAEHSIGSAAELQRILEAQVCYQNSKNL